MQPSRLEAYNDILVLDASVVINLSASDIMADILKAIDCQILIPENVLSESLRNPATNAPIKAELENLNHQGLLDFCTLDSVSVNDFLELTGAAAPNDLHDGEAATIAIALGLKGRPVIDDRKAIRRCSELYPSLEVAHTIDFFCHSLVGQVLSLERLRQGLNRAFAHARMWLPNEYGNFVLKTIGNDNFYECRSISGQLKKDLLGERMRVTYDQNSA